MAFKPYLELAKLRLTAMVLITTVVGYVLASADPIDWAWLFLTVLGTGLAAVGTGAVNEVLELRRDAARDRSRRYGTAANRG
jgi:heme o synthase